MVFRPPDKPTTTTTPAVTTTTPAPRPVGIGAPTGVVTGAPANNGVPWSNMNRYDASYVKWGNHHGIDPAIAKAMTVVESGGKDITGGQPGSTGILQIKPQYWQPAADRLGVSLDTPDGQIAVANHILASDRTGWERNFRRFYFPHDDPITGITQDEYVAWIKKGVGIIHAAAPGGTTTTTPAPTAPVDPLRVVMGGTYAISQEFGVRSNAADYSYGLGHGLDGKSHTGIDISANLGAPLYSPVDGVVVCVATNMGSGSWGTGCYAFNDYMGKRAGRVEVLSDQGVAVIFGHSSTATVRLGERVRKGQQVATVGGMNGSHVHLETRERGCDVYCITDPRKSLGGKPSTGYAPGLPISQPDTTPPFATMRATRAEVPVLQRGYAGTPAVRKALDKGETIRVQHQVLGDAWYAVDADSLGRVPMAMLEEAG